MGRRWAVIVVMALLIGAGSYGQAPAATDPWAGLRFLIGTWEAKTTGGAAQAASTGAYSFQLELRGHVLARHSAAAACKAPDDFDCQHRDLLYIYPEGPSLGLKAIYFDNEGHTIHYAVSTPKPGSVVFLSESGQPGPEFRLTYELVDGVMAGKFQVRMGGQTEYKSYLEWRGKGK